MTQGISRCTQNTAFMEEWRKGWHPERVHPKGKSESVLIVGAGPAGLEAAHILGKRGYQVTLAEATTTLGGRVARERTLPGLSAWGRVADYRAGQIAPMPNVQTYLDSRLTPDDILSFGIEHVAIATGCHWRRDAVARLHLHPIPTDPNMPIFTPDDLMAGGGPKGSNVLLYDDDHFYMGSVMAELLVARGCTVDFVTPAVKVAEWTDNTLEQATIQRRLAGLGVRLHLSHAPDRIHATGADITCTWNDQTRQIACDAVLMVTARIPEDALFHDLKARDWKGAGIASLKLIGDAAAPGPIAWATYAGRRYAEELDQPAIGDALSFRREIAALLPPSLLTP
jgi:dimethylamine/trimethylamine dehydrogenase